MSFKHSQWYSDVKNNAIFDSNFKVSVAKKKIALYFVVIMLQEPDMDVVEFVVYVGDAQRII